MSAKQYIVTFDNCEKHDLKDELQSLGITQVYVLSTIPGNFVRANLTDDQVELVSQNDHVLDVIEMKKPEEFNDELPSTAKEEEPTPKFFFGLNTANSLSEIQSESKALKNLNLDINDIDKIRGIRGLGLDRNDLRTISGLDFNLIPELAAIDQSYKTASNRILQSSSTDVYTEYSINVDGPYSSRGFKYNFIDPVTAQNKIADVSTSRVSSWSSFDDNDNTTPIYYGGDVEIVKSPATQKSTLSATQLTLTQEPKLRRFGAEVPTDLVTLTIDGVEKQFYAMRGIPLRFTGIFRSLFSGQVTHKIVQLTENDPLPTWTIENLEDNSLFEFEDLRVEDSIRFSDFRVKEREVSFYYPPTQIESLGLSGLFMREMPNVTIDNLKELDISRNDLIELPNISFIAPVLETLNVSDQNLMRSKNDRTARQQLLSLPSSLKSLTANAAFLTNNSSQNEVPDFSNLTNLEFIEFNATGLRTTLTLGEFITLPEFASNYINHPTIDITQMQPSRIYEIVTTGDWDYTKFENIGFKYTGDVLRWQGTENLLGNTFFDWVDAVNLGLLTALIESPITNDGILLESTSNNPTVRLVENDIPLKEVYFVGHDTGELPIEEVGRMLHSTVLDANKLEKLDVASSSIRAEPVLNDALAMYLNYKNDWLGSPLTGDVNEGTGWVRNNSFTQGDKILIPTENCPSDRISSNVLTEYNSFENYIDHLPIFSNCEELQFLSYQKEVNEDTVTTSPLADRRKLRANYRTLVSEYLPLDGLVSLRDLVLSGLNTIFDLRTSFQNFPSLVNLTLDNCGTLYGFSSESFSGTPLLQELIVRSAFFGHNDPHTETRETEAEKTYVKFIGETTVVTRGSTSTQLDVTEVRGDSLLSHTHHFSSNNYIDVTDFGHENTENSVITLQPWKQQNLGEHIDIVAVEVGSGAPSSDSFKNHPDFLNESNNSRFVAMDWGDYSVDIDDPVNQQITNEIEFTPHSVGVLSAAAGVTGGLAKRASLRLIRQVGTDTILECLDAINAWHQSKPVNATTGVRNPTVVTHAYGVPYDDWAQIPISAISSIVPNGVTGDTINRPAGGWTDFTPFTQNNLIPRYSTTLNDWVIQSVVKSSTSLIEDAAIRAAFDAGANIGVYHFASAGNDSTIYAKDGSNEVQTYVTIDSGTNLPYKTGSDLFARPIFGSTYQATTAYPFLPPAYKGSTQMIDVAAGHMSTKYPRLEPYSARGPAMDIIGSGSETLTAYIHTSTSSRNVEDVIGREYRWFGGTSCAAPTAAGIFACMLEKYFKDNGSYPATFADGFALLKNDARDWLIDEEATDWSNPPGPSAFNVDSIDSVVGSIGSSQSSYLIDSAGSTTDLAFLTDNVRYPDTAVIENVGDFIVTTEYLRDHTVFANGMTPVPLFTTDCLEGVVGLKRFEISGISMGLSQGETGPVFLEGAIGELPDFSKNQELTDIIIEKVALSQATFPDFEYNKKLLNLVISDTLISGNLPALSLPELTTLTINKTRVVSDDTIQGQFPILNCRQLINVTITTNPLLSGPIRSFANCPFIQRLQMSENNFTSYNVGSFRSLSQCIELEVAANQLSTNDIINILNDMYISYTVNPRNFVEIDARNNNTTLSEVLADPTALQNYTILTQIANWSISI